MGGVVMRWFLEEEIKGYEDLVMEMAGYKKVGGGAESA